MITCGDYTVQNGGPLNVCARKSVLTGKPGTLCDPDGMCQPIMRFLVVALLSFLMTNSDVKQSIACQAKCCSDSSEDVRLCGEFSVANGMCCIARFVAFASALLLLP